VQTVLSPAASGDSWYLLASLLALAVPVGAGLLAAGLGRGKNAAHTMTLALLSLPLAVLAVAAVGFGLMCGGTGTAVAAGRWLLGPHGWGFAGGRYFFLVGATPLATAAVLAAIARVAAAAAIPIGATAERWRVDAFSCFTVVLSAVIVPVGACWVWGGGWIARLGGIDVGGSAAIHLQAGAVALVTARLLGPRAGKFDLRGRPRPIVGHHLPIAMLGNALTAIGIVGLNLLGSAPANAAAALLNTILAGAAGAAAAALLTRRLYRRPDPSLIGNGLLAGLVAVAAGCTIESPGVALATGAIAGCLVVPAVLLLERRGVDDPVGAISTHGLGGLWGTLAVGLFSGRPAQYWVQAAMALACVVWPAVSAATAFVVIGWWMRGNRVAPAVESLGLDIPQLGVAAYPEFLNPMTTHPVEARPLEPRPAHLPANTTGRRRYAVVIDGADPSSLIAAWSALCQAREAGPSPHFAAVYPYLTTVSGNRFRFNGGEPALVRSNLEQLLAGALDGRPLNARVES
jgi:Amt family ammonium transporter